MDNETLHRTKHTILFQVVRDILIEKGLVADSKEFYKRYNDNVEKSGLSEEDIKALKEDRKA